MEVIGTVTALNTVYNTLKSVVVLLTVVKCMLILNKRQDDDQPLSVALTKCGTVIKAAAIGILMTDFVQIFRKYWGRATGNSTDFVGYFVSGLEVFVEEIRVTLLLLDATLTAFFVVKNLILMMKSDVEDKPMYKKKAIKNFGIGIAILCAYGLITLIFKYFV